MPQPITPTRRHLPRRPNPAALVSSASSDERNPLKFPQPLAPLEAASRHGRLRFFAVVLAIALLALLGAAGRARAGVYTVSQCSTVTPFSEASWERSSGNYMPRDLCGSDQGLQVFHNADDSGLGQYGAWVWRAPAGTVFTNVNANSSVTNQAGHRGGLFVTTTAGDEVGFGIEHNDFRFHSLDGEFTQFASILRCTAPGAGKPCGRAGEDSAHAYVRGVYLRTDDRSAPALTITGGSMLDGEVIRGVRGLAFSASDAGGGIRKVFVVANGTELVTDIRNCAVADGFATALSPCPLTTTESAAVPTASPAFVTGPDNYVSACVEDLASDGFANRTCEPRQVWVDNACPASAVGGGTALRAGFGSTGSATGTALSDRASVLRGTVSGAAAGATVCALTRDAVAGAPIVVGATATTAADGSFALALPPGPSREVFLHYVVGDSVIAQHGLALTSSVRPRLTVHPSHGVRNHDRLSFAGRLPGPACVDRLVKVQAKLGKARWQVFRTDRTDTDCRFAARYKLHATDSARRYRFRALVPQAEGYPYARGDSQTVKVKIRRPG
jgi:hypothetical protein